MRRMETRQGSRIVRIDGFEIACTLPELIGNAMRFFDRRVTLLVRLTDADGQVGWGETWSMPGAAATVIRGVVRAVDGALTGVPTSSPDRPARPVIPVEES